MFGDIAVPRRVRCEQADSTTPVMRVDPSGESRTHRKFVQGFPAARKQGTARAEPKLRGRDSEALSSIYLLGLHGGDVEHAVAVGGDADDVEEVAQLVALVEGLDRQTCAADPTHTHEGVAMGHTALDAQSMCV